MTTKLVIIGTGLQAQVMHTYFTHSGQYEIAAFSADKSFVERSPTLFGLPVVDIEALASAFPPDTHQAFVAIGFRNLNSIRARFFSRIKEMGYKCASYIHPSVVYWPNITIGENVFVFEDNTIQPFVTIGDDTTLWSGNHIGHHSQIGAHCFISSHVVVSGSCVIGDYSFLGVNATLRDGLRVGVRNIIGPGSLILRDTEDNQVFLPKGTEPRGITSDRVKL